MKSYFLLHPNRQKKRRMANRRNAPKEVGEKNGDLQRFSLDLRNLITVNNNGELIKVALVHVG